jgi:hypothetical protein
MQFAELQRVASKSVGRRCTRATAAMPEMSIIVESQYVLEKLTQSFRYPPLPCNVIGLQAYNDFRPACIGIAHLYGHVKAGAYRALRAR